MTLSNPAQAQVNPKDAAGSAAPNEYISQWQEWHQRRFADLTAPYSWLALTGIHWLGSEEATTVDSIPGTWRQQGDQVFYLPEGVKFPVDGNGQVIDQEIEVKPYESSEPTKLYFDQVQVELIRRDGHFALRTRDPQAPTRTEFPGINHYPVDPSWRVPARFERLEGQREVALPAVVDGISHTKRVIGQVHFQRDGQEYSIDVLETNGVSPSILFRDETTGKTTYGAGRFIYLYTNDLDDLEYLDFNRAINPPCYYSDFCTCPTAVSRLTLAVTAGERTNEVD